MNRKQIACIIIGSLVFLGMLLCVPVSIHMNSLFRYFIDDPSAGYVRYTNYKFISDIDFNFRAVNIGVFLCQCFVLFGLLFCNFFALDRNIKNTKSKKKKWIKLSGFAIMALSLLMFCLWLVMSSLKKEFNKEGIYLILIGTLALMSTYLVIEAFISNKSKKELLQLVLLSIYIFSLCMSISFYSFVSYYKALFGLTTTTWRLFAFLSFIIIWICFGIEKLYRKRLRFRESIYETGDKNQTTDP